MDGLLQKTHLRLLMALRLELTSNLREKAFFVGEKADPLRWSKFPAVKGVMPGMYSDDRTILIVNFI